MGARVSVAGIVVGALVVGLIPPIPGSAAAVADDTTLLISLDATQGPANSASRFPTIDLTGRKVAFVSDASDIVAGDTNGKADVFLRDTETNTTTLVSAAAGSAAPGNGASGGLPGTAQVDISADGRYVVFSSLATNLVTGDTNGQQDVFLRDVQTGATTRVNVGPNGAQATAAAYDPAISADGSTVAFYSDAPLQGSRGLYLYDRATGATTLAVADPTPGRSDFGVPSLNGDGKLLVFSSTASNLVAGDTNGTSDVFAFDRTDSRVSRVSLTASGAQIGAASTSGRDAVSADGQLVVFATAGALAAGDTNGVDDVYARNQSTGAVTLASLASDGKVTKYGATDPAISDSGRVVAFLSKGMLTPPAKANNQAAYTRDLWANETKLASVSSSGVPNNNTIDAPVTVSGDGRVVGFASKATNLAPGDTNGDADVFARYRTPAVLAAPAISNLAFTASPTAPKGVSAVPIANIPVSAIPLSSLNVVASTALRSIDPDSAALRSIALRSIALRSIALRSIALRSILLSDIPLLLPGGWEAALADTALRSIPAQSLTLDDVLALSPEPAALRSITLADLDLSHSALRSISFTSVALGATALRSIPLPGGQDWCAFIAQHGFSCADLGINLTDSDPDNDGSLFLLDLAGFPMDQVPLQSIALRSIDLSVSALRSIALRSIALRSIALRSIALRSIDISATALRSIALRSIADGIVTGPCPGCETLGDAAAAGAIRANATLGDLVSAISDENVDLGTLGELLDATAPGTDFGSVAELILALLGAADIPWEQLPLDQMRVSRYAEAPAVEWTVSWTTSGQLPSGATKVTVALPPQFTYRAGSATLQVSPDGPAPIGDPAAVGDTLVFEGPLARTGSATTLRFTTLPGLDLSEVAGAVDVEVGGAATGAHRDAAVTVVDPQEPDTCDAEAATLIQPDVLYFGRIDPAGDRDCFRVPVPSRPGTNVAAYLSHLGTDLDLAMFSPNPSALRSIALRSIALRSIPVADLPPEQGAASDTIPPDTLQDIPLGVAALRSISAQRGTEDETVETRSQEESGAYVLQVSGYNGTSSTDPYVLRVREIDPVASPQCPARTFPYTGSVGGAHAVPSGVNTLFLYDQKRMGALYGPAAAAQVRTQLEGLAADGAAGVKGHIVALDRDSALTGLYAALDLAPCSPEAANAVAARISQIVRGLVQANPTIGNVVVVGSDPVVPMARLRDETRIANEQSYASELGAMNPLRAAALTGHLLSDDVYGDLDPVAWLDDPVFVPDLAVGRLVETPDDIVASVQAFRAAQGRLDPGAVSSSLTTGYDFLADGAQAVNTKLAQVATDRDTLINETWTRQQLVAKLFPAGQDSPDIASINAHYDHHRALPAAGNTADDESDLFTTDDIQPDRLAGRVLFTMGCHAGLNVPDVYLPSGDPLAADWARTLRNAVFVGNTGYGYGDTAAVALSEQLMANFAGNLKGNSVGDAHAHAKQEYFAGIGVYGAYDYKVLQQSALYGLPMYRLGTAGSGGGGAAAAAPPAGAASAAGVTPERDPLSGLQSAKVTFTPTYQRTDHDGRTLFTANGGGVEVENGRPIVPTAAKDVTTDGLVAKGVIPTGGHWNGHSVKPAIAGAVVDDAGHEPPTCRPGAFPSGFANINRTGRPGSERDTLVAMLGQSVITSCATAGTTNLASEMTYQVFYGSADTESQPPTIRTVTGNSAGSTIQIEVDATDDSRVVRVVGITLGNDGTFRTVELARRPGTDHWVGQGDASGAAAGFVACALDEHANTGCSTNKAFFFSSGTLENPRPLAFGLSGDAGENGWYRSTVQVTESGTDAPCQVAVDGGPYGEQPATVSGDGEHRVDVACADGSGAVTTVRVDGTAPSCTITSPTDGQQVSEADTLALDYTCTDDPSGVADTTATVDGRPATNRQSLTGPGTAGHHTIEVTGRDAAGNSTTRSASYDVTAAGSPKITSFNVNPNATLLFITVNISGTYTDAAGTGPHTLRIDWGDGSVTTCQKTLLGTACNIDEPGASGSASFKGSHNYSKLGLARTITVTVTNKYGMSSSSSKTLLL